MLDQVIADFREIKLEDYAMPYHYVVALLTLMRAAGWRDVDYGTLVVESGVGLSFGYIRNHCVAMYSLQEGAHDRIARATGFQLEWHVYPDREDAWAWVKETIDRGQPVAAEYSEFHVVAGYRHRERPEDRQWYVLANEPTSAWDGGWLTWEQANELSEACPWSNFGGRYAGRVVPWEPAETAQHVIEWIVEWSDRHPGKSKELYAGSLFGLEAIEAYASDIGDVTKTLEEDFVFGNNACHAITPQWTTRRYIAAYLEERSRLYADPARSHILEAAGHYHDAYASWTLFDELLGQRYMHRYGGDQEVGWADPERRQRASAGVYAALEHEKAAVAALRTALPAIAGL
jgi:hypothetical protein